MLQTRSSTLSGHNKLWFLTLVVFVVLVQTSPGNQNGGEMGRGRAVSYPLNLWDDAHGVGRNSLQEQLRENLTMLVLSRPGTLLGGRVVWGTSVRL